MLIIFTGTGKGKTTAAIGQAMRAVGDGRCTLMVQFIKGPWKSGEDFSSKKFGRSFKIVKKGLGFVGIGGDKLPFEKHKLAAKEALSYSLREVRTGKWDILILDEVWVALHLKLITSAEVKNFIKKVKPFCEHIIMTGRACPERFIGMADLVTDMREVKHPFRAGKAGAAGLEY